MSYRNKIALWALVVVLVLAAGGVWLYHYHDQLTTDEEYSGTDSLATSTPTSSIPVKSGATGTGSTAAAPTISYTQAVAVYAKSRLQFDEDCHMTPATIVLKNGTTVMFDNRGRDGRYFRLDGVRYYLPGYGFKLLKLSVAHIPHNVDVDCGTTQNTGRITLE